MTEDEEAKIVAQVILNAAKRGYDDGFSAGRAEGLHEAARIVLATVSGYHRALGSKLADHIVAAIGVKVPNIHSTPPEADLRETTET